MEYLQIEEWVACLVREMIASVKTNYVIPEVTDHKKRSGKGAKSHQLRMEFSVP